MNAKLSQLLIYISVIIAMLLLTVVLIEVVMSPPLADLIFLIASLGITSLVSAAFGFLSHRLGWWRRLPHIRQTLILGYILAGGLALINIWLTAKLMFINQHDLILATILLIFAGGISIAFGYFISNSITHDLQILVFGAKEISKGDFATRVSVSGEDEVAQLALAFNQMAARLENTAETERALDEARRNLVAWASHDLRTPLASLKVMLDAMAEGIVNDPETIERYLKQSQNEVSQMSILLDDLFELAQLDAGYLDLEFQRISLSDLISDTLEGFSAKAKAKSISLQGSITDEVDPIWAAPDKISRILDNLVSNALRYTPSGGNIFIEARLNDDQVLIEVRDSGSGITPKDLPHVFDRFYRGEKSRTRNEKNQSGGIGLGLSIVKGLIKAHGGEIGVNSELGSGTTFWFTLPKHASS
ncbi:MAG: sensor histidine kinase [Anaerolineales bacterium]